MNPKLHGRGSIEREIAIETIVAGIRVSNGILYGLRENLTVGEVGNLATDLRQLRKHGEGIILRCRETFPYMIPLLSEVDGIISPKSTVTTKGHSAEFCREEGKTLVVADEPAWQELESYEGETIMVDPKGKKIVLAPDRYAADRANTAYTEPQFEIEAIARLIKEGRHISLLSSVPEPITARGEFSYFCRQEQLVMSTGKSPWDLLTLSERESIQILHTVWTDYAKRVQPGVGVVCRSHDARSDEYPGSPLPKEPNPQLGNHGPSLFEKFPHLLQAETAAIARVKSENPDKPISYLLPFVRGRKEIQLARRALSHALERVGLNENSVELAVMFETPALPYLTEELREAMIRTIWIGTKDLLMSFLMIDRDNPDRGLQEYLKLVNGEREPNFAFLNYLNDVIEKLVKLGFSVIMYALASEAPVFAKYLPRDVGFLISKGSVKQALSLL